MTALRNPFTPMLLTYTPTRFYGRENEIISILQVITAPEPNGHAIYGIRTIGKTTLLKFLKDPEGAAQRYVSFVRAEYQPGGGRRLLFVYLNFHNFKPGDSVFVAMFEQLIDDMKDADLDDLMTMPTIDQDMTTQDIVDAMRTMLNDLEEMHIRVVFLLDDFDAPVMVIDANDDGLLRTLNDHAALIIVTEDPISELRPDIVASSPLLGILRPEAISLIPEGVAHHLINDPIPDTDSQFSDGEIDFLVEIAGRQPFLLTAAAELYYDMRRETPNISQRVQKSAERQHLQTRFMLQISATPHVENVLQLTWKKLDDDEKELLRAISEGQNFDLLTRHNTLAVRLSNKALIYWNSRQDSYQICSLLFANFIRQKHTNNHRGGTRSSTQLADHLTPIDRALLQYFLDHSGQVCTFDELLDAVWEDSDKSKRALDAAVYRLRKSLSDDEQIKNVRGKGYKFVAVDRVRSST